MKINKKASNVLFKKTNFSKYSNYAPLLKQ